MMLRGQATTKEEEGCKSLRFFFSFFFSVHRGAWDTLPRYDEIEIRTHLIVGTQEIQQKQKAHLSFTAPLQGLFWQVT